MGTRVNISYSPSVDPNEFGHFRLTFKHNEEEEHTTDLKFNFSELWDFSRDTSSVAFDFLILAMVVYNTDRAISRERYSFNGWRRQIYIENVPVINLSLMNRGREAFNRAINFLTGDTWDINFVQAGSYNYNPNDRPLYNLAEYEKVSLFSGGLDSLIGFVDEASSLLPDRKIVLVSHVELGKEGKDQENILNICKAKSYFDSQYLQLKLNVGLKKGTWNIPTQAESTFRARSLLFFAAGIYVANSISPSTKLIVPENGTISINIPLDVSRRGACSTRTTHPTFIKRLQDALSRVGITNELFNPYQLKSKADMMSDAFNDHSKKLILTNLYKASCSCAKRGHNSYWDKNGEEIHDLAIRHCGMCLPCLYRRVALDSVGLDNPEDYGTDVNHGTKYNIDNLNQKRVWDYRALLSFIKLRNTEEVIRAELMLNGISDKQELSDYTQLALNSYEQVKEWIRKNANSNIRRKAGLR